MSAMAKENQHISLFGLIRRCDIGQEFLQSNLTGGELAPTLHARVDLEKYDISVAAAENVVIVPQGGLRRRPGLSKITDTKLSGNARLVPFVFNKTQQYLLVFKEGLIDVLLNGTLVKSGIVSPYATVTENEDIDIIQSADTVIITHPDYAPRSLVRGATDADWTLAIITLTIPTFEYVVGTPEPVWSATRGYPISCTFHQGRLWFGGSPQKPTSVWGSRVNGYYDFTWVETSGVIPDDHAIFDTIESAQYNKITNIFSGRELQVFSTGAEYINTTDIITPNSSSWRQQTNYGSLGIRPIMIDGATLYIDSSGRTIRQFIFNFDEDSHVSNNITLLASHLMTDIKDIAAIKGTSLDVSDYVYVVNGDGTVAVMNTLRNEGILGWTKWTTDGEFLNVCVVDKEVYFLVKRKENYFIEQIQEDTYTDHNVIVKGTEPTTYNIIHDIYNTIDNGNNIIYTDYTTGIAITTIDTDFDALFDNTFFKVIADFSMKEDSVPTVTAPGDNYFTVDRDAYRIEVGLDFTTRVLTLPINTALNSGVTLHKRKRVVKADINIHESLGIYANSIYAADREFTVVLDEAPQPYTGFKEMYLLGYDRITQIEITQKNPLPMLIRAIGFEIEY